MRPCGARTAELRGLLGVVIAATVALAACGPATEPEAPAAVVESTARPPAAESRAATSLGPLTAGETRHGILEPDGAHLYRLDLEAGDAVRLEVDQDGIDLQVTILDPDGAERLVVDLPVGREAPERLCFVARAAGAYGARIEPFGEQNGGYRVQMERRPASEADEKCAAALEIFVAAEARRYAHERSPALVEEFARAGRLWIDAGEPFLVALARREIGSLWLDLGRSSDAIDAFEQALTPARAAGSGYLEGSLLNRLGLAHLDRGNVAPAGEALLEALALTRRTADRRGEASALHNLGQVAEAAGETHQAIERYHQALVIWSELGRETDRAQTQRRLADAYGLLDHHQEALHMLEDALAVFRRAGHQRRQASTLLSIGWVHYLRGEPTDAVTPLRQALELQRQIGNRNGEAAVLDRLGTALREIGDFPGALEAYRGSFTLSEETRSPRDAANTAANIGCLYQEQGRVDDAGTWLADARERLLALDDPKALSHVESCLARVARQRGDTGAALGHIEQALAIVDGLRGSAHRRGARYRPIWLWQDYSELHLELLMDRHRATGDRRFAVRAFEQSDLARARNLFELVLESLVGVRTAAPRALIEAEHDVQRRLNAVHLEFRELRNTGAPAAEVAVLERRLGELSLELERAREAIRAADPRFAELAAPRPVRLEELQALLDPETVLLSYALGAEHSTLFAVGRASFESWNLAPRPTLDAHAEALYEALRRSRFNPYQVPLAAGRLAEMLLPTGALPPGASRILVVTDGMLHYVPMGVLPSPRGGERLLAEDFEIRAVPSASVLAALRRRVTGRPRTTHILAVFADAVFSDADPRLRPKAAPPAGPALRLPAGPLPRLPHTATEACTILDLVPEGTGLALLGFDASKQAVIDGRAGSYEILHFATHALIDERFPELSGLVLSRRDPAGRAVDGDLHLHEIYGLRLAADLVVLSGCQTALGQRVRGDGLVSLARGFLYAGASQLLVSLWSVDDEATAELMAELYRGLLVRGEPAAAALRSAQLRMRGHERWSAPYYWAGFVLQGAGR